MQCTGSCFIVADCRARKGFFFIVRLCSMPFSRRIAHSYASCGFCVSANKSSAIFSFCMCAGDLMSKLEQEKVDKAKVQRAGPPGIKEGTST